MKKLVPPLVALTCLAVFSSAALGQARVVVKFARGSHSGEAKGSVRGYTYIDYVLGARAGQSMSLELTSDNDKAQMVVLDPDNQNLPDATGVAAYNGTLGKNGNYVVRVLMSRAEARRKGSVTKFLLTVRIE